MKYTFLGHQSWMIEEGKTKILLDPLLKDTFGSNENFGIEITPSRIIEENIYKNVSAVFITHEHSDHFHLESLNCISRETPIYVGILTLSPVIASLESLGFKVYKLFSKDAVDIGNIIMKVYQSTSETAIWESRVYQCLFTSKLNNYSLFIAVDALISKEFSEDIQQNLIPKPDSIMISNNSQIPPTGVLGSLDNSSVPEKENSNRTGPVALNLVKNLIVDYSDIVHNLQHIILCGGGFMKSADSFGQFMMSNQSKIAHLAQPLFPEKTIHGALPGYVFLNNYLYKKEHEEIKNNEFRQNILKQKFEDYIKTGNWKIKSLSPSKKEDFYVNCDVIIQEFTKKYSQIIASSLGRTLVSYGKPNNCFEILLEDDRYNLKERYNFCLFKNTWEKINLSEPKRPFGVHAMASDFVEVVRGKLQIWDLAGLAVSSWYDVRLKGGLKYSPMTLLYSIIGEHFNVSQFRILCENQVKQIKNSQERTVCI